MTPTSVANEQTLLQLSHLSWQLLKGQVVLKCQHLQLPAGTSPKIWDRWNLINLKVRSKSSSYERKHQPCIFTPTIHWSSGTDTVQIDPKWGYGTALFPWLWRVPSPPAVFFFNSSIFKTFSKIPSPSSIALKSVLISERYLGRIVQQCRQASTIWGGVDFFCFLCK